ncbi:restriction endonuclease subunit S [Gulosibacter sp. GYB002]|uniref:restriction endonuclease subunit S n=1 Tax=Gulosibacter sp. GYB002 TaxID=2994391 RepID=UPI002F969111
MNEMKPSGVAWIGEIPSDWSAGRFKTVLSRNDGGVWGDDPKDDGRDSVVFRSTEQTVDGRWRISEPALRDLRDVSNKSNSLLAPGDLLITKSSGSLLHIGKTSLFEDNTYRGDCYYSNFMQRLRVSNECYPKFYWYVLNSSVARDQFEYLQNATIGLGNLSSESIGALRVPFPSMSEQKAIADRLDAETAKIDQAISLLQRELETLEQLKKSLIYEAVTKGLDPTVPMRSSGVDWIGDIPEHWSITRLSTKVTKVGSGKTPLGGADTYVDEGIPLIRSQNIFDGELHLDDAVRIDASTELGMHSTRVRSGDVLLNITGASIGRSCVVPGGVGVANVNQHVCIIRPYQSQILPLFLHYLWSTVGQEWVFQNQNGATREALTFQEIRSAIFPIPDLPTQQHIVTQVQEQLAKLNLIQSSKEEQLRILNQQRASLIFEYVTGKRRVSEVA